MIYNKKKSISPAMLIIHIVPFHSCIVASSNNHFSHVVYREGEEKKAKEFPGVLHTTDSYTYPNKEILDKSRKVFAVRWSCLHYSRECVFTYLAFRFSLRPVAFLSFSASFTIRVIMQTRKDLQSFYYTD